jgi:hypothetical protein
MTIRRRVYMFESRRKLPAPEARIRLLFKEISLHISGDIERADTTGMLSLHSMVFYYIMYPFSL